MIQAFVGCRIKHDRVMLCHVGRELECKPDRRETGTEGRFAEQRVAFAMASPQASVPVGKMAGHAWVMGPG